MIICDDCAGTGWGHPDNPAGKCQSCQGRGTLSPEDERIVFRVARAIYRHKTGREAYNGAERLYADEALCALRELEDDLRPAVIAQVEKVVAEFGHDPKQCLEILMDTIHERPEPPVW